jgi:hypothetical protein
VVAANERRSLGVSVARELDRLLIERGKPKPVVSEKWQRTYQ